MARCLVTGATGFIGSHLVPGLLEAGWDVHALVRPSSRAMPDKGLHSFRTHVHVCDTRDHEQLTGLVGRVEPDVVIHLATAYIRDHAPDQIDELIESNITFGCRLMEAMIAGSCGCMVATGTAWQHMEEQGEGYRPATLYAATKQAFEDLARWYVDAHGVDVTALHLGDTYGPNDPRAKLFSLLADAADSGEPLALTPGEQRLDPLHVADAASALEIAARRLLEGGGQGFEIFEASPRNPVTLRELAAIWCEVNDVAPDLRWGATPYRERQVMTPWQGGRRLPGWKPRVGLEEGLRGVGTGRA